VFLKTFFLAFLSLTFALQAATVTWDKAADGNLGESSSWSGGSIPGISDSVVLNSPYSVSSNLSLSLEQFILSQGNLYISTGDTLTISDNLVITSPGNLSGLGNISANTLILNSGLVSLNLLTIHQNIDVYEGSISGNIDGTGNLTKLSNNTVYLSSHMNYSGNTKINAGKLSASSDNTLPTTTDLIIQNGSFDLNGFNQTISSLSGSGNLVLGSGTMVITQTANTNFSGNISGTGNLVLAGIGTLTLDGQSNFNGNFDIRAGSLVFLNSGAGTASQILNGGNVIGTSWSFSSKGLYYGTVNTRDDESTANPKDSISTDLAGTEDGIASNTTEIWTGYIYDVDGYINFRESNDDESYYKIDGSVVLNDDTWNATTTTGNLNLNNNPALPPGWHNFEMRFSNGGGGAGPQSGHAFSIDWDGGTSFDHPMDNGFLDNFAFSINNNSVNYQVHAESSLDLSDISTESYHDLNILPSTELSIIGNLHLTHLSGSGNFAGNVTLHGNLHSENDSISTTFFNDLTLENGANLHIQFGPTTEDNLHLSGNLNLNSSWNISIEESGVSNISPTDRFLLISFEGALSGNLSNSVTFSSSSSNLDISTAELVLDSSISPNRIYITNITDKVRWNSNANGNWSTGGDWVGGQAPAATDSALLDTDYTITVDVSDSIYNYIQTNGQLDISTGVNLQVINTVFIHGGVLSGAGNLETDQLELQDAQISLSQINISNRITITSSILSSTLLGQADLIKQGSGNAEIYANNQLSGNTSIFAGTLYAGSDNVLSSSNLFLQGGTFSLNGFNQNLLSFGGTGDLDIGSGNLVISPATDIVYSGNLSGNGQIILNGSSTLSLSGTSTFTGTFVVKKGTLDIEDANTTAFNLNLAGGNFIGQAWSYSSSGLWYGEVDGRGNRDDQNTQSSLSIDLLETEDGISSETTEVWNGFFYDNDGQVNFQENNDDTSYYKVDQIVVLDDSTWNNSTNTSNLNLSQNPALPRGWHEFEMRFGNGSGGSGPVTTHAFSVDWDGGLDFDHPTDSNTTDRFIYDITAQALNLTISQSSNLTLHSILADSFYSLNQSTNTNLSVSGNLKLTQWNGTGNIQGNVISQGNITFEENQVGRSYVHQLSLETGTNLHIGLGSTSNDNIHVSENLFLNGNWNLIVDNLGGSFINPADEFIIMTYGSNISGNLSNTVSFGNLQSDYDVSNASLLHNNSSNPRKVILTGVTDFYKWTTGTDGNWDVPSNWNLGTTPSIDRSVKLNTDLTITLNSDNTVVNYQQTTGTLNIQGGSNLHISNDLSIEGGSMTGTGNLSAQNLNLIGGSLSISDITVYNSLTLQQGSLSSNLHGSISLIKNTTADVVISSSASSYSGNTVIQAGTLFAGAENILPPSTLLMLDGGTFSSNGFHQQVAGISGNGTLNISAGNMTLEFNDIVYFSGNLSGTGNLVIRGGGTFVYSGVNEFSGQLISESGTLELIQTNSSWNHNIYLAGGNFRGGLLTPAGEGLWFGDIAARDDETTPNPMDNVSINLATTEDSIASNTTEVYSGYLYDPEGYVNLRASNDDDSFYKIDQIVHLNNNLPFEVAFTGNIYLGSNISLPPGWHEFEMRFSNGTGGSGPTAGHGFSIDWDGGINFDHPMDNGYLDRFTYDFMGSPGLNLHVTADSNLDFNYLNTTMNYDITLSNNASLSFVGLSSANINDISGEGLIAGNTTFHGNIYPGGNDIGTLTIHDGLTLANGCNIIYGIGENTSDKIVVTGNLVLNSTWHLSLNDDGNGVPDPNVEYDVITYTGSLSGNITTTHQLQSLVPHWVIDGIQLYHDTSSTPKRIYLKGGYIIPKPPLIRIPGAF
jgi:autotransporter-associated beta strand protein